MTAQRPIHDDGYADGWTYPCTMTVPRKVAGPNHAARLVQSVLFHDEAPTTGTFVVVDVHEHENPPPGETRFVILFDLTRPDHEADYCNTVYEDGHDPDDDVAAIHQLEMEMDEALTQLDLEFDQWPVAVSVDGRTPIHGATP